MTIKLMGAILVFTGCGGFGFAMASAHRREEQALSQLMLALEFMECDLSCRLTPLPQLCYSAANTASGQVHTFFLRLGSELERFASPDVQSCVCTVAEQMPGLSSGLKLHLTELGNTLGRFDLPGQLRGLRSAQNRCRLALEELTRNRDSRLRSYQTLGLCAGAALAILFL